MTSKRSGWLWNPKQILKALIDNNLDEGTFITSGQVRYYKPLKNGDLYLDISPKGFIKIAVRFEIDDDRVVYYVGKSGQYKTLETLVPSFAKYKTKYQNGSRVGLKKSETI